jgi:hypothetical protein
MRMKKKRKRILRTTPTIWMTAFREKSDRSGFSPPGHQDTK